MWLKLLPYIGAVGFLVAAYFWFQNVKREAYNSGYEAAEVKFNELIAAEDVKNRAIEEDLKAQVASLLEKFSMARTERETIYRSAGENITRIIKENPYNEQCDISPELLLELNRVREQGPK